MELMQLITRSNSELIAIGKVLMANSTASARIANFFLSELLCVFNSLLLYYQHVDRCLLNIRFFVHLSFHISNEKTPD